MAINWFKCVNNKQSINAFNKMLAFNPIIDSKMCLTTDKSLEVFEQKSDRDIKNNVLEKTTHTGQSFGANDYRLLRFSGKQKEINPRFAINLIAEVPPIAVKERWASCDGGGGPLGHPKVFINVDDPTDYGTCGYCGLRFFREGHKH